MTNSAYVIPTAADAHYFAVNAMDTRKSFWTFEQALVALEEMAKANAAGLRSYEGWVGDIYAFTTDHRYISVPGDFGRAVAKIVDGQVIIVNMQEDNLRDLGGSLRKRYERAFSVLADA